MRHAAWPPCEGMRVQTLLAGAEATTDGDDGFIDWFLPEPLTIVAIFLVAGLLTVIWRWMIRRVAERITHRNVERAGRIGVPIRATERLESRTETLRRVLAALGTALIWTLAVLVALGELDINLGPLIAGAGVVGVALGFGAQTMVRDYLAGFFIVTEDQYGVGDWIDIGEVSGEVEDVSLRATQLRDIDGTLWTVANGEITHVGNQSKQWARARLDLSVAYGTDLRAAMKLLAEVTGELAADPDIGTDILEPPEVLGVQELAADGVTLRVVAKTRPGRQFAVTRELQLLLKERLDEAGIEIPFPQRVLWNRDAPPADQP